MIMGTATSKTEGTKVVPQAEWLAARKDLLKKEKEFTRLRDELSRQRREMPWEKVEKRYVFDGPKGNETLADLFGGKSQLIVYHFMFGPGWKEGCPSCSYLGRYLQRRFGPPPRSRHDAGGDFAGDPAGDRSLQEAYGMAVQVGVLVRERIQL